MAITPHKGKGPRPKGMKKGGKQAMPSNYETNDDLSLDHRWAVPSAVLLLVALMVSFSDKLQEGWKFKHLPAALRPSSLPTLTDLGMFVGEYEQRFKWGTYRPGLYFGVRARTPQSTLMGLMWTDPSNSDAINRVRHEALQSDGTTFFSSFSSMFVLVLFCPFLSYVCMSMQVGHNPCYVVLNSRDEVLGLVGS